MSKPESNSSKKRQRKSAKKSAAIKARRSRRGGRPGLAGRSRPASSRSMLRGGTKGMRIVEMLRAPAGATIAGMAATTGWQPHSVRGFLAGVVRKRLKLNLVSEPGRHGRIYRVKARGAQTGKGDQIGIA